MWRGRPGIQLSSEVGALSLAVLEGEQQARQVSTVCDGARG